MATVDLMSSATTSVRSWLSVAIVAVAVFMVTTTEMIPVGLLPAIARDLAVSDGAAGLSVSLYGVLAGLLAPVMTVLTGRVDRRVLIIAILTTFVAGNALSALAQNYVMLMAARIVAGLTHGLMWSIVAIVAISLVAQKDSVRATAAVFSGISMALVLGVPLGTVIGNAWGWRWAFGILAGLCAITLAAVVRALPPMRAPAAIAWRHLAVPLRLARLRRVLALTAVIVIGNYAAYTYVAPLLADRGIAPVMISPILLGYGIAGVAGNFVSGAILSRMRSALPLLAALTATLSGTLVLTAVVSGGWQLALVVTAWGLSYSAIPVVLQTLVLRATDDGGSAAATSIYVLVFNCSIAAGAFGGAVAIDTRGPTAPIAVGAALCIVAAVVSARLANIVRP